MQVVETVSDNGVGVSPALTPRELALLDALHKLPRWKQWLKRQQVLVCYYYCKIQRLLGGLLVLAVVTMISRD
jgi:hypothetical protein